MVTLSYWVDNVNPFNPVNYTDWISQAEAARLKGVSRQAIGRLIKRGRLKAVKIAGRLVVRRTEVLTFEAEPTGRKASRRKDLFKNG
jgi:excisionase family DNA binding protein